MFSKKKLNSKHRVLYKAPPTQPLNNEKNTRTMVNIVTPPMSPVSFSGNWENTDDEDDWVLHNNGGINLLSAFDMEAFAEELEEHPEHFEDEIDFIQEEEFDLEIPELQRSTNMHEVHGIDPLDEDNMPREPPQLIRENAMNFTSFLTAVVQEYNADNNNPHANIITYFPEPLVLA